MEDVYDQENFYHDELERDWDERYEHEPYEGNEDAYLDAAYEDRYAVEDF